MNAVHVHASCAVIGDAGVLIRGPSGAGKSTLARRLIDSSHRLGLFGRLVADDRVRLVRASDRVVARPFEAVRGLIEIRGLGLAATTAESAAVIRLVVDVSDTDPGRFPTEEDETTDIFGIRLRRLACRACDEDRVIGMLGLGSWSSEHRR
jgi:HPr kinase/phosphorylase